MSRRDYSIYLKKTILALLTAAFYLLALFYHQRLYENVQVAALSLSGTFPTVQNADELLDLEEEQEKPVDACFYESLGYQSVEGEEQRKGVMAEVVALFGQADLYDSQITGFAKEDREGCVLGGKTAWELFGSREVVGKEIFLGEKVYVVRQVLRGRENVLLIHPRTEEWTFHSALLRTGTDNTREQVSSFLMRHGLSGELSESVFLRIFAGGLLILLPLLMSIHFLKLLGKLLKGNGWSLYRWAAYMALSAGFLGILIFFLIGSISIPREWIPGKWSDFAFWGERWEEMLEGFRYFLRTPKSYFQAEQMVFFGKSVLADVGALFCYLIL